jgi:molecular chaperone DnaJ
MNLKEAYQTLGLSEQASEEEVKKKYKELTRKYHPDVNKEPDADAKFKKINEAYQTIKNPQPAQDQNFRDNPFGGNPFAYNPFKQRRVVAEHIALETTIDFQESVLGSKKNITYNRKVKCGSCDGHGELKLDNGCTKCKGKGQISITRGSMVFIQTCDKCYGRTSLENCKTCSGEGSLDAEVNITVTIPGGVMDGNILRLANIGHFIGQFMGLEQHSDVHLHINVKNNSNLHLEGTDVISSVDISLLEALQGCQKNVATVLGDKQITIKPLSKHNDYVLIPKVGVNKLGNQKVFLHIHYPQNINKLIDALQSEG